MTYEQSANIIVKNNIIDQGNYDNGSSTVAYKYAHSSWIYGSSIIEGNTFMNPAASADMLNITDGSCIVRNNKFIRASTSINSYIKHRYTPSIGHDYSGIDEITDNIFDQTTIDGYIEDLVIGLNPGAVYTRNRNQSGYIYIPLFDNNFGDFNNTGGFNDKLVGKSEHINTGTGVLAFRANDANLITKFIKDSTLATNNILEFSRSFNISGFLEKGMKIINARIGGFMQAGHISVFTDPPEFVLMLKSHIPLDSMDATAYASTTFNGYTKYSYIIASNTEQTALQSSTQYTVFESHFPVSGSTLDGDRTGSGSDGNFSGFVRPNRYRIGNGRNIELEFTTIIGFDDDTWDVRFSPIEIKYQW